MKDTQIKKLIAAEKKRQKKVINLIASENYVSAGVLEALGSELTNKYAEGYSQARYYGGNQIVDKIEKLCQDRALKAFKLSMGKWHAGKGGSGLVYAMRAAPMVNRVRGKVILMHREVFGPANGLVVDHINGNTLDNRRANLRACTVMQNGQNQRTQHRSSKPVPYKGVGWHPRSNMFRAYIVVAKKQISLGYFHDAEKGARAYDAAAKHYFGEFARLNFPNNTTTTFRCHCGKTVDLTLAPGELEEGFFMTCYNTCTMWVGKESLVEV